jgi:histidyl-tRNA synthetase
MIKSKKINLSSLEKKCLMKFYLHELKLFKECSSDYVKSLGVEMGYETILSLAEETPECIKVAAHDENNFVILLDERCQGKYLPLFIMKDGTEKVLEGDID